LPPPPILAVPKDMEQPPDAAARCGALAVGALSELLALVFERLPHSEQSLTVGRLAREWRRWAAPRRDELRRAWSVLPEDQRQLPLWCLIEAWPRMSGLQRGMTALLTAEWGNLERLRWLPAQDPSCPWRGVMCDEAAHNGHLDVLRWLRAQDPPYPWDKVTCSVAAASGHLDVLRWLRAQDPPCPWDERACTAAARGGHLDALRWMRAQDPACPWNKAACRAAARSTGVCEWIDKQPDAA
jgi:hypothetical protein